MKTTNAPADLHPIWNHPTTVQLTSARHAVNQASRHRAALGVGSGKVSGRKGKVGKKPLGKDSSGDRRWGGHVLSSVELS